MESTPEALRLRYTVVLAARNPGGMIQLTLEPEGSQANPRPVPESDEERVAEKVMDAMQRAMPGIPPFGIPQSTTILMLAPASYQELGSPTVGETLEFTVKRVE